MSHIVDIERAVLSTLFFQGIDEDFEYVINNLRVIDLTTPAHKNIYEVIKQLYKNELPFDETFVKDKINPSYEYELINILSANAITNIQQYTNTLIEYSRKRLYLENLIEIRELVENESISIDEANEKLELLKDTTAISFQSEFKPKKMKDIKEKEVEFWLKEWIPIPKNTSILLSARGGVGKSNTILHIAHRISKNNPEAKLLLWFSEDSLEILKSRANMVLSMQNMEAHMDNIEYLGLETFPFYVLERESKYSNLKISDKWYRFKQSAKDYDIILLDPLIAFYGADENNNGEARLFMNLINAWCVKNNKTVILIHHGNKSDGDSRGAGAFVDAVRLHYSISYIQDDKKQDDENSPYRMIELKKDNWNIKKLLENRKIRVLLFPLEIVEVENQSYQKNSRWDCFNS